MIGNLEVIVYGACLSLAFCFFVAKISRPMFLRGGGLGLFLGFGRCADPRKPIVGVLGEEDPPQLWTTELGTRHVGYVGKKNTTS